ncbi:transporter substrate-binding domain-containing protein [Hahella aquimaris]|uniref:substrate-binding periplasmic protein n=1 Tax=Hahella sp. HNIBRBA332 TaxID=3015983 RepID=UPI00273C6D2D|nr:transporter substrate-binding domain-containing protein [Hahella sp. HNIBRBA332]WLQ16285.1 transporter substrate-binding domain-containing protein [Hahella sp. HNIBRBA332]
MMKNLLISVMYCALLCPLLASAEDLSLTNGEWPPFTSENYRDYGFISRVVAEAYKLEGINVKYTFLPWKRALQEAREGDIWVGSVAWSKADGRPDHFLFSEPIIVLTDVFFHRKDLPFDWNSFEDLKPYRIGATIGYSYGKDFSEAEAKGLITVERISTDESNFKKLAQGRINLFPCVLEVGYEILAHNLPSGVANSITNHPKALRSVGYHVIITRKYPQAERYIAAFNRGLQKLKDSGRYEQYLEGIVEGHYRRESDEATK